MPAQAGIDRVTLPGSRWHGNDTGFVSRQRIAIGATVDPVPPLIFSGCTTNANS